MERGTKLERPALGEVVAGRYRLDSVIGQGGMGTVFKAEHISMGKRVAVKMLLAPNFDESALVRFRLEAKLASQLNHPNIINITDFDVDHGRPFLVMEYLKGRSLDKIIRKFSPLPLDRFERIMLQACAALGYAHSRGVVHRDIKSSNLMITEQGGEKDVLVIVDFGLIKVVSNKETDSSNVGDGDLSNSSGETEDHAVDNQAVTAASRIVGSPLYMSPEQIRGQKLDARTDVYSLGCVMYEVLSGKTPFEGASYNETFVKHLKESPAPLNSLPKVQPIPAALETLILDCLAKDRDARPKDMQELADRLARACKKRRALEDFDAKELSNESSFLTDKGINRLHGESQMRLIMILLVVVIVAMIYMFFSMYKLK